LYKALFINLLSYSGINYERYLDSVGVVNIVTFVKYGILPFLVLALKKHLSCSQKDFVSIMVLLATAFLFRVGMSDFEVVSRVSVVLICMALFLLSLSGSVLSRLLVAVYLIFNCVSFGFFGWEVYPDSYAESDNWFLVLGDL